MKPRFIDEMRNITVEVGRDVTFTCTVSDIHVSIFSIHSFGYLCKHFFVCMKELVLTEYFFSSMASKPIYIRWIRTCSPSASYNWQFSTNIKIKIIK